MYVECTTSILIILYDIWNSGWIRPIQIFNHLNMEYGQFEKHIFSIYDVGNSKLILLLL